MAETTPTPSNRSQPRLLILLIPFALYFILLLAADSWVGANPDSPLRVLVTLTPMVPGVWLVVGVLRGVQRLDKNAQNNLMDGVGFSFGVTLFFLMTWGLLEFLGLLRPLSAIFILIIMCLLWMIGRLIDMNIKNGGNGGGGS